MKPFLLVIRDCGAYGIFKRHPKGGELEVIQHSSGMAVYKYEIIYTARFNKWYSFFECDTIEEAIGILSLYKLEK